MLGFFFSRGNKEQSIEDERQVNKERYPRDTQNNSSVGAYCSLISDIDPLTAAPSKVAENSKGIATCSGSPNTETQEKRHFLTPLSAKEPIHKQNPANFTQTANAPSSNLDHKNRPIPINSATNLACNNPNSNKVGSKYALELCPEDKESFSPTMDSTSEVPAGEFLLPRNLPVPKLFKASKMPSSTWDTKASVGLSNKMPDYYPRYARYALEKIYFTTEATSNNVSSILDRFCLNLATQQQQLENKRNNINKIFLTAVEYGDLEVCEELLDKAEGPRRPDVNVKGDNEWRPLHFACSIGNKSLVQLLIRNETDIEAETELKYTPLTIACEKGHKAVVELLIQYGANINATDVLNNTPLHYASLCGHKTTVELLLQTNGIDVTKKNHDNNTAADLAKNEGVRLSFRLYSEKIRSGESYGRGIQTLQVINEKMSKKIDLEIQFQSNGNLDDEEKKLLAEGYSQPEVSHLDGTKYSTLESEALIYSLITKPNKEKIGPESFTVYNMLGRGSFGEVYLVEKKDTKELFAMKTMYKSKILRYNLLKYALTERNVLGATKHPFIIKLHYAFQTADKLFLVLDYCPGGDLGDLIKRERRISEELARIYLAEMILALEDLHKRDIIFRDLKPDNIVLDAEGHAVLTDFGLSREDVYESNQGARSFCGSIAYLAPEILNRMGHGKAIDWYLLGVLFYEMVVGVTPYYAPDKEQLFQNIQKAPLRIPAYLTTEAKSLLKGLLHRNTAKRLGAGPGGSEEIKSHPFFESIDWSDVKMRKLKPPIPEKKTLANPFKTTNIFEDNSDEKSPTDQISGWTFIANQK